MTYIFATVGGREIPREDDEGSPFTVDLGTVLTFVTGADHIPPLGFPSTPIIQFISEETRFLPTASTCIPSLFLPLQLADYEDFKRNMDMAVICAHGFGSV